MLSKIKLEHNKLTKVKSAVIKQAFAKNGAAEKARNILDALHEEGVYPESEEAVANYWLSREKLAEVMPSLVCPASLHKYNNPAFCVAKKSDIAYLNDRDRMDSVVYELKNIVNNDEPAQAIQYIDALISFLQQEEFNFTLEKPHDEFKKSFSENLLQASSTVFLKHLNKKMDFPELNIYNTPAHEIINLASELKYWMLREKSAGQRSIDLSRVIANYPYPLKLRKPTGLQTQILHKLLAGLAAFADAELIALLVLGSSEKNAFTWPLLSGYFLNQFFQYDAGLKYFQSRWAWQSWSIVPYLASQTILQAGKHVEIGIMEKQGPIHQAISFSALSASFIMKVIMNCESLDILYREKSKELRRNLPTPDFGWLAKAFMLFSLVDGAWSLWSYSKVMWKPDDVNALLYEVCTTLKFLLSCPAIYLASRQSAQECYDFYQNPRAAVQTLDGEGFRESLWQSSLRRVGRFSAPFLFALLGYIYDNDNPLRAIIACIAAFNDTSLQNAFRWTPALFRFPVDSQSVQKSVSFDIELENKGDEPNFVVSPVR